ncbi:hypothetical protein ACMFMF_011837 [Clarireedia jacksonii]
MLDLPGDLANAEISISTDWLVSLNMGTGASPYLNSTSFFSALIDLCGRSPKLELNNDSEDGHGSSNQSAPDVGCMTTGFSLAITEGLSKLPHNSHIYALSTHNHVEYWNGSYRAGLYLGPVILMSSWYNRLADDLAYGFVGGNWSNASITEAQKAGFTRFDFTVKQRLYRYSFRIHMLFLLTGQRWYSGAWSSLGQLFILALRSPPPPNGTLDNVGGGVKVRSTWRLRAKVKVLRDSDNQVGFVIGDSNESSDSENPEVKAMIYPDKVYS